MTTTQRNYGALAGVFAVAAFMCNQIFGGVALPLPGEGTGAELADAIGAEAGSARLGSMLQAVSALGLLWFAASVGGRLATPYRQLAVAGGIAAAALQTVSVSFGIFMTQEAALNAPDVLLTLQYMAFLTGGVMHVIWLAPMLAGIAVGSARIPKWLTIVGLVLAVASALSILSLMIWEANAFIPLGRYGTFLWILIATPFLLRRDES